MAKDSYYFSHDYHARTDLMIKLAPKYGIEGIGIYWCLVEMLHEEEGYLMLSDCKGIAYALHIEEQLLKDIISTDLFEKDEEKFWSNSALRRLQIRQEKSEKARDAALKRWEDADAVQTHIESTAIKEKEKKENIKVKETKEDKKKYGEFQNVLLTDIEYTKLKERFNSNLPGMIETLSAGIESKGYKYKSHYATIINWARRTPPDDKTLTRHEKVTKKFENQERDHMIHR